MKPEYRIRIVKKGITAIPADAIVNAAKVRPAFNRGNMDLAKRCSRKANRWCTWSLVLGIIMWVVFTVLMVSFFEVLIDSI